MASSDPIIAYLSQLQAQGSTIVTDQPKLDIESYIQNYTGRTRFERLLHIGKTCAPLSAEALKAAVHEAKSGRDTHRYKEAWDAIRHALPGSPEAVRDEAWIERIDRENKAESARLESELKGYKNNLIKESIRMGNEDLGKHYQRIGSLNDSVEAFGRMRHDVTTSKQIVGCGLHLIDVSVLRRDWSLVLSNVGKITNMPPVDEALLPYISIVSGLALLGLNSYHDAAKHFLQATVRENPHDYSGFASPNDVAIYGGLLSLATMERPELQKSVLDNSGFRVFLEQEPHVRKAISLFVNGRYSACLKILEASRNDYLLDIYLSKHVNAIFSRVRSKCIKQFFTPFSCVTMDSLQEAFGRPGESLEDEIAGMIKAGTLQAKIDSKAKLLVAVQPDPRLAMQKSALEVASKYEHEAKERLRRISLISGGYEATNAGSGRTHRDVQSSEDHVLGEATPA